MDKLRTRWYSTQKCTCKTDNAIGWGQTLLLPFESLLHFFNPVFFLLPLHLAMSFAIQTFSFQIDGMPLDGGRALLLPSALVLRRRDAVRASELSSQYDTPDVSVRR